jgi:hypothetical protein
VSESAAVDSPATLSNTADLLSIDESTMETRLVHAGNSTVEPPPIADAESDGANAFSEKEMEYWRWLRSDQPKTFYCCDVEAQSFPLGVGRGRGGGTLLLSDFLAFSHTFSALSYFYSDTILSYFNSDAIT